MTVEVAPPVDLSQIRKLTRRIHQATNREQFLVSNIRKFLKSRRPRRAFCTLGVTVADLYPSPEWNFVLGEASMGEGCGVFSFGRYFNSAIAPATSPSTTNAAVEIEEGEREQLKNLWVLMRVGTLCGDDPYQNDDDLYPFSFLFPQVMSHELCHIFGLKHCYYFNCAMNESASIAEAATQPLFLCPVCLRKMHKVVGFNPLERYRQMLQVIKQLHSAVMEASPKIKKEDSNGEGADNESVDGEMVGTTMQVSVEVSDNLERNKVTDAEISETIVDPSDQIDQIDHNATDTSSNGQTNRMKEKLVDGVNHSDSSHEEQFEEAIVWLERVVSSLARFEDQWVELRAGHRAKSKVV
jgi:archaemetzincin